ncbi:hypothetical protein V8G54_018408 [Vigna mungo]|uniref:Retrotransposon gag domain-containing protein n=1 Tax=Vigna mungo TaxID=3915 RepID=A0AAQ3N9K7_VIGMU
MGEHLMKYVQSTLDVAYYLEHMEVLFLQEAKHRQIGKERGTRRGVGGKKWGNTKRLDEGVEFPTFEGVDLVGWISRAEKFFEMQNFTARERMRLAYITMEGRASYWFRFWKMKTKNPSWRELTEALIRRFGRRSRCSVFEKMAAVRQRGAVEDYIQEFEIRSQIRPHNPRELLRAMEIARDERPSKIVKRWDGTKEELGLFSRTETFRGVRSEQGTASNVSTARKEGSNTMVGSKIGGNTAGKAGTERRERSSVVEVLIVRDIEKNIRVLIMAKNEEDGEGEEDRDRTEADGTLIFLNRRTHIDQYYEIARMCERINVDKNIASCVKGEGSLGSLRTRVCKVSFGVSSGFLVPRNLTSLAVVTLGDKQMAQRIDGLDGDDELKRFYLQTWWQLLGHLALLGHGRVALNRVKLIEELFVEPGGPFRSGALIPCDNMRKETF